MIAEFVRSISGIQILGIAGLFVSMAGFCVMLFRVWRIDRTRCEDCARLPLEPEDANPPEIGG